MRILLNVFGCAGYIGKLHVVNKQLYVNHFTNCKLYLSDKLVCFANATGCFQY